MEDLPRRCEPIQAIPMTHHTQFEPNDWLRAKPDTFGNFPSKRRFQAQDSWISPLFSTLSARYFISFLKTPKEYFSQLVETTGISIGRQKLSGLHELVIDRQSRMAQPPPPNQSLERRWAQMTNPTVGQWKSKAD
jgi:hypothetical protein